MKIDKEIFLQYSIGTDGNSVDVKCHQNCKHSGMLSFCALKKINLEIKPNTLRQQGYPAKCLNFEPVIHDTSSEPEAKTE